MRPASTSTLLHALALLSLCQLSSVIAKEEPLDPECTLTHPTTKEFYDLRGLARWPDEANAVDWHANPYDYAPAKGGNFSLNVCAPLIRSTRSLSKSQNISAVYSDEDEKLVSLGQTSTTLKFRGKKLVLEYTGGGDCPGDTSYKRSTLIVFTCDASMVGTASVSYLGEFNDCGFAFEYRTFRACATTPEAASALSPGVVFLIILIVALLVYLVGGCMYNRTVLHQAGWQQVPHSELWLSIGSVLSQVGTAVMAAVGNLLVLLGVRRRQQAGGYDGLSTSAVGGHGYSDSLQAAERGSIDRDNALIDDLDDDRW